MSAFRNDTHAFGLVSRLLHWGMALLILGLMLLGFWMTGLDYYHPWYHKGPDLHRAAGVTVFFLLWVRLLWHRLSPPPPFSPELTALEALAARVVHRLLYLLMLLQPITGYLLSTADGRAVSVFGLFSIPAPLPPSKGLEDTAGAIHQGLAWFLLLLIVLHVAGALKHHFLDRGDTLSRMTGLPRLSPRERSPSP